MSTDFAEPHKATAYNRVMHDQAPTVVAFQKYPDLAAPQG